MAEPESEKYLPELMAEKDSIDQFYVHAVRLIKEEIERITNPKPVEPAKKPVPKKDLLDVTSGKHQKVECDISVPVERHPHVNFVGRLIGPGGSTMKGIQELTNTRIAVLGKGSVRQSEREKAEQLKDKDEKYAHLNYPLHVHISALGPVPQAFVNLGRAVAEIQKLIIIDEATEAQYSQGMGHNVRGRGGGNMGGGMRGRGGGGPGRGFQRGGRGGGMQRGGAAGRGNGQGTRGGPRGGGRGRGAGRGQVQSQFGQMQQTETYAEDYSYDAYGGASGGAGYDQSGYEAYDESYDAAYGADAAYGEGSYGEDYSCGQESYDGFGNGASVTNYGGQASFRGKMRGGGPRGRQKPY